MKDKRELNFEIFYKVDNFGIIDDPNLTVDLFAKDIEDEYFFGEFLKKCSFNDFVWVVLTIFKDKYGNGDLLRAFVTESSEIKESDSKLIYFVNKISRSDIYDLICVFSPIEYFKSMEFRFDVESISIENILDSIFGENTYQHDGDKYTFGEKSGIKYLEVNTDGFFKLEVNVNKAIRY